MLYLKYIHFILTNLARCGIIVHVKEGGDRVRYVYRELEQLPPICEACEERKLCMAEGFGEACCDECDYLLCGFELVPVEETRQGM